MEITPRFTPTCVGKTGAHSSELQTETVHPHVRGEDTRSGNACGSRSGSPPRAWGRRLGEAPDGRAPRFTPTCVGKTRCSARASRPRPVHPHVRGEDLLHHADRDLEAGSPPRAWGRQGNNLLAVEAWRFTPTCVGKTSCAAQAMTRRTVHPHVRGEDGTISKGYSTRVGSPPRAWGRRVGHDAQQVALRFTPTCVGKTIAAPLLALWPSVHPHVRGEDVIWLTCAGRLDGSPPRAWGRLGIELNPDYVVRFTPTCVGKTPISGVVLSFPTPLLAQSVSGLRIVKERRGIARAVSGGRSALRFPLGRHLYQSDTLKIPQIPNTCPVGSVTVALGQGIGPNLQDAAVLTPGNGQLPEFVPNPTRGVADKDTRSRLNQPSRQLAPQTRRDSLQDHHEHRAPPRYPEAPSP